MFFFYMNNTFNNHNNQHVPVVYILDILYVQELAKEVHCYCEKKTTVEKIGGRLTEMSRKEDCDVIHNLIMTVQDRYKKLHQRLVERSRILEEAKKSAKQVDIYFVNIDIFFNEYNKLHRIGFAFNNFKEGSLCFFLALLLNYSIS